MISTREKTPAGAFRSGRSFGATEDFLPRLTPTPRNKFATQLTADELAAGSAELWRTTASPRVVADLRAAEETGAAFSSRVEQIQVRSAATSLRWGDG